MSTNTESATTDGLEVAATSAKVLVRQLNQAAWACGEADANDSWKRQERTAATQDRLLNESLAAIDTLLASSRAEVERLRKHLADVLACGPVAAEFHYLDRGIGTATAVGMTLLAARAALSTDTTKG